MYQDDVKRVLAQLLTKFGAGLARDPERCQGLLEKECGKYKKEIFLLSAAHQNGVVEQLFRPTAQPIEGVIQRIGKALHRKLAIVEEAAIWAAQAWAEVLGLCEPKFGLGEQSAQVEAGNNESGGEVETLFSCPNCSTLLKLSPVPASETRVVCPDCRWMFRVNSLGRITARGSATVNCPVPGCRNVFTTVGGQYLRCPRCITRLRVFGDGAAVILASIGCNRCYGKVYYPPGGGEASCDECDRAFVVSADGAASVVQTQENPTDRTISDERECEYQQKLEEFRTARFRTLLGDSTTVAVVWNHISPIRPEGEEVFVVFHRDNNKLLSANYWSNGHPVLGWSRVHLIMDLSNSAKDWDDSIPSSIVEVHL